MLEFGTVELQWLKHLWNYETIFETGRQGLFEVMCVNLSARSGVIIEIIFSSPEPKAPGELIGW